MSTASAITRSGSPTSEPATAPSGRAASPHAGERRFTRPRPRGVLGLAFALALCARTARADELLPWIDSPSFPTQARSVVVMVDDLPLFAAPRNEASRRGSAIVGARLPIYAARTGPGCTGHWLMIGPLAWLCSTKTELTDGPPLASWDLPRDREGGLPFDYFFVGRDGSAAYRSFELADASEPEQDLQPGFGVTIVKQKAHGDNVYGQTHHGLWVPMRDLIPVRPFHFKGEELPEGQLDVAWVLDDKTPLFAKPDGQTRAKQPAVMMRFQRVKVLEEGGSKQQPMLRVGDGLWLRARDVRRPRPSPVPGEVRPGERWIDVELASQTLVAYEGERPVFATIVSTGKGAQGTANATPKGVHRIWVKLRSSTMDNLDDEYAASTYAIEDVPYVQFFHKGVALHGAFWHKGFGRVRSHGCVNLAPLDAQRVFAFTGPRLPAGWSAALPTEHDRGTVVQVR